MYTCMYMEAECNKTTPVIGLCRGHTESVNAVNLTLRCSRIACIKIANVKLERIRGISNICIVPPFVYNTKDNIRKEGTKERRRTKKKNNE